MLSDWNLTASLQETGADRRLWMRASGIGLHPQKPFEPRRLCMHTVLKRNNNRAQGVAEKYFCIGREWRWDWQAGEKRTAIQFAITRNCPTQEPLSSTHGALDEVPATGNSFLGGVKVWMLLLLLWIWLPILQSLTVLLHETTSTSRGKRGFYECCRSSESLLEYWCAEISS